MKNLNPFSTSNERAIALDSTQTFSSRRDALVRVANKNYVQGIVVATIGALIGQEIGRRILLKNNES